MLIYVLSIGYSLEVSPSHSEKPVLITVPNGIAAAIVNPNNNIAKVLVLADIAWKPNDNEMKNIKFEDYDWNKWK